MNRNQVKGALKDAAGKVQEGAGRVTGNRSQEAKGLGRQAAGKVQKGVGDAVEAVRDAARKRH